MPYTGGLYIPDHLQDHAVKRAARDHRGKMNAYILDLIQKDKTPETDTTPAQPTKDAVVALAKTYQPAAAEALAVQLANGNSGGPVNQPLVIARFLDALLEALKAGKDVEAQLTLGAAADLDALVDRALERLATKEGLESWGLNEPATFPGKKKTRKKTQTSGRTRSTHPVSRTG